MTNNDIIGKRFGRLVVLNLHHKEKQFKSEIKKDGTRMCSGYHNYYLCKCDCGKEVVIYEYSLKKGVTTSCGCYIKEKIKNGIHTKHGKTNTRPYTIWCCMKQRCYNKNHKEFKYWGGKGITVCDEWRNNFENFYNWAMNNGYKDNLSIDRIDGNKNYCPENCRWATSKEQAINQNKPKHYNLSEEQRMRKSIMMVGNQRARKKK